MALTACPECSRQISTAAVACPGCGLPMHAAVPAPRRRDWAVPAIAVGGVLASLLGGSLVWNAATAHQRANEHVRTRHVEVVRTLDVVPAPPLPPSAVYVPTLAPTVDVEAIELDAVDEMPQMVNAREVSRTLARVYPPALRDAGISGRVVARFQVTAGGAVDPGTISVLSSTHDAFGEPAVHALRRMRFRPAHVDGRPVATWLSIPISFDVDQ